MVQSAWAILPRTLHGGDLMDGGRSVAGWSGIGWQALRLLVRIPTVPPPACFGASAYLRHCRENPRQTWISCSVAFSVVSTHPACFCSQSCSRTVWLQVGGC